MRYFNKKPFNNEIICFTGKSPYTRVEMEKIAMKNGARITKNITSATTLLVMGARPGSKLDRAFHREINIMMDEEFLNKVKSK